MQFPTPGGVGHAIAGQTAVQPLSIQAAWIAARFATAATLLLATKVEQPQGRSLGTSVVQTMAITSGLHALAAGSWDVYSLASSEQLKSA